VIYLHKILPIFLLPTGITLILVAAGLLLRWRVLCWTGLAVLWLASTPLVGGMTMRAVEGGQVRQPAVAAPQGDAIVVLSGGRMLAPGKDGISEWTDADRFYGAVELYKSGKAPLLVFTGGWAPWQPDAWPEGDVLIAHATSLGIPRDRLLTTGKVLNTREEADAVARLLAQRFGTGNKPRVLLVTSAFQMRRAAMLFAGAGVSVTPFPVDFKVSAGDTLTILAFLPSAASLNLTETALREFYGILYYRLVL
jgi:uncharacterized SAM-binding protein YcdF (DUF218 family)